MNSRANKIGKSYLSKILNKEDIKWINNKLDSVKG